MPLARVLVLCTGNSCRSQMAEGVLKSLDPDLDVQSAGTRPAARTHPDAVSVMDEVGIDISGGSPMAVEELVGQRWDWVVTVCGGARESCPVFTGEVRHQVHIGFDDPADATGNREQVLSEFRRIRDEIRTQFTEFYRTRIVNETTDQIT